MKLSICVPVYNGAATIARLVDQVAECLADYRLEFVLVNDGSKDDSDAVCAAIASARDDVTYVCLRRNFGEHNAVMCALNHCTGDYAVIVDDDFQNPPSEIIKLVRAAEEGHFDVVYAKYHVKKHSWFRNLGSKFNDAMATALLRKPKDLYLCSFKLISRDLIDEIVKYTGPFPYIDGLLLRSTDNVTSVFVEHRARAEGTSNYTLGKLVSLWLNMFINFSIRPLRIISLAGLFTSLASFLLGIAFIVERVCGGNGNPPGWASIVVLVLFLGGIQTFSLGVIGEYIGKNYLDRNGTPQWTVKSVSGKLARSSDGERGIMA